MKRLFAFLLVLFSYHGFAQTEVEWFQPGQEWYYRVFCLQNIDCGYIHYSVEGIENLGGEEAAVLTRSEMQEGWNDTEVRTEYLRYENDTVWRFSVQSQEWHMLYDFGAEQGDVWTIQENVDHGYGFPDGGSSDLPMFEVVVDSAVFWAEVPDSPIQNRRVIYTSPSTGETNSSFAFGLFTAPIIEGIGPVGSAKDLIGNNTFVILPTYEARFQCFLDNGELVYGSLNSPCNILSATEPDIVETGLVYPNPAVNFIKWDKLVNQITLVDATGRIVLQKQVRASSNELSLGDLPRGFYTVVMNGDQGSFSQKLILKR